MGTDEGTSRGDGPGRDDRGAAQGDPVRDLLLGLANQIDALAALFAGGRQEATAAASGYAAAFGADGPVGHALAGASGEIGSLLSEIGDLVARLLAAVIAVLEAIAEALRSAPSTISEPRHYEPIAVRIGSSRRFDAHTGSDEEQ
ncbi:hypothetical protein RVF83_21450 [Gordonia rubripertincta]|uniref:Uncharacterized protein n=2 Tax=Gordonia rubripertincta TaxID=36822 RepID=A0AAW6R3P1_GORRU|nr:hypothetical protein [Gordonia rubripertincta]MDG6779654.1 hypothetical protein [Gordonia rubripertincta]NKY62960.1 hypothetical protein [Gordonia rubripertincta]GAB87179.1 hypothetical protein GORBP_097_00120 [Gordonia rubripertincta NBRC 101908]